MRSTAPSAVSAAPAEAGHYMNAGAAEWRSYRASGIIVVVAILCLTLHVSSREQIVSSDSQFVVVNSRILRLSDTVYDVNGEVTFLIRPKSGVSEWLYIDDWHYGVDIAIQGFNVKIDVSGRISIAVDHEYEILEGHPILFRMWNNKFCVNFRTPAGFKTVYKDSQNDIYHINIRSPYSLKAIVKSNWYEFL